MSYKRIGIVGGVGPSATVLYYKQIIQEAYELWKGKYLPEIVIHSLNYEEIKQLFLTENLKSVTVKLVKSITCLEKCGCNCIIMACNGMHLVFEQVQQAVRLPILSIIDAVINEIKTHNISCVGLMGTTPVMQSGLYQKPLQHLGIRCVEPSDEQQHWIMKVILKDLQLPSIPEQTFTRLLNTVEILKKQGSEEIILTCTDLPVAIKQDMCSIPLIDSTKVHVKAALDYLSQLDRPQGTSGYKK